MRTAVSRPWLAVPLVLAAAGCRAGSGRVELADHHVHLLSPALLADWKSLGVPFSRSDEHYLRLSALAAEVASDGEHRLAAAVVVPMAHLYGNDGFRAGLGLDAEQERLRVLAENDWCIAEARAFEGRAVAYASVDFRRPYAESELRRAADAGAVGLKLHLASAGADLRDPGTRARIAALVGAAAERDLAVLLHLDPQLRGHETEHMRSLLDEALGPHPDLRVTVAHLGGSGGFGPWTRAVLATLTEGLEDEAAAGRPRPGVMVDVSAALLESASEGVPATTGDEARALAPALRRLGLQRVVLASDHPVFSPVRTLRALERQGGLAPEEIARIAARRAPALR